jgi:hypothetical protein
VLLNDYITKVEQAAAAVVAKSMVVVVEINSPAVLFLRVLRH